MDSLAKIQRQGSNWRFSSVLSLNFNTVKYEQLGGSSYISLSAFLAAKKAIINLKNEDDECFKLAGYTSIKSSSKYSECIDKKLRETSMVFISEGLKFPVNLSNINIFLNHNFSISVNVFGYENMVYPLRISKHNYKRECTVNILLISDNTKQHYCWIKDISKVLSLQTQKHDHVRHVCSRCLNIFNSKE